MRRYTDHLRPDGSARPVLAPRGEFTSDVRRHPAYHLGFFRGFSLGVFATLLIGGGLWVATR